MTDQEMELDIYQLPPGDAILLIDHRSVDVSPKVKTRLEIVKQQIQKDGSGVLLEMENDFYEIAENPNAWSSGAYKGWTKAEVKELYECIYGRKME